MEKKFAAKTIVDFSKLCIHTITTKPWSIDEAVENYATQGVKGITVWFQSIENYKASEVGRRIRDHDLKVVSMCRGGFFASTVSAKRAQAIQENLRAIEQAAELGAPLIVLVCGSDPGQSLEQSRLQIEAGIERILLHAQVSGVKLAIEPLHPMYADKRSAINTLKQANDICMKFNSSFLGVVVDVYHLWWDPDLEYQIKRSGEMNKLFAFHLSDWKTPTDDLLNDRGLMGEGCIPIRKIRSWVENSGFNGYHEVEIFSHRYWAMDQFRFLENIKNAYLMVC